MANTNESKDPKDFEKIEQTLSKAELYIENNQKKIMYIVGAVVLVIGAFFAYKNYYLKNQETKAISSIWQAENSFKVDSFKTALYGNETVIGFSEIAKKYSHTKTGNLAKYYAGVCCLHIGEFEDAIDYLEGFSTEDPILGPLSVCDIGDAYNEMDKPEKAIEYYVKASDMVDHEMLSPKFLMKAGLTYEKLGQKDKALEMYTKIKNTYDTSPEASVIDKYITRVTFK